MAGVSHRLDSTALYPILAEVCVAGCRRNPMVQTLPALLISMLMTGSPIAIQAGTPTGSLLQWEMNEQKDPLPASGPGYSIKRGVKIPMRDRVELAATVYLPPDAAIPHPTIVAITPYSADSKHGDGGYFAKNGYTYVAVDTRGRGNSGGKFQPFEGDGVDGYDVIEWVARQPWSNGKVAMMGGSYLGFVQWATAANRPPHLVTITPTAAVHPGVDFPHYKNINSTTFMQWLTDTYGVADNQNADGDFMYWRQLSAMWYESGRPFSSFDEMTGMVSESFQKWISHPQMDSYWEGLAPKAADYKALNIPILSITGYYDDDQMGALTYYDRHMRFGQGTKGHFLVIGPWDHAGTRNPSAELNGMKFAAESVIDMRALHLAWYDWTMKGGKKPSFLANRVMAWSMGSEKWVEYPKKEAMTSDRLVLNLHSDGHANTLATAGKLSVEPPAKDGSDEYVDDPLKRFTERALVGGEEYPPSPLFGSRRSEIMSGDSLIYETAPLTEATHILGRMTFEAWLVMDVPDADFIVEVSEIKKDGTFVPIAIDFLRARYRDSLSTATLVTPGTPFKGTFDWFNFTNRVIEKGSRLRVIFGKINLPQTRNLHSGKDPNSETGSDGRVAHVQLLHDQNHPSRLVVPLGR